MSGKFAYDEDYYAWTKEQARLLREVARERINTPIDWEHIAEELDILGGQIKDAIRGHLATVNEHLLKLEYSPDAYPRKKWRGSVRKARRHLEDKLADHPSLKGWPTDVLPKAWLDGQDDAVQDDSMDPAVLPNECPYTLNQIRDPNWWPASRHGLEE